MTTTNLFPSLILPENNPKTFKDRSADINYMAYVNRFAYYIAASITPDYIPKTKNPTMEQIEYLCDPDGYCHLDNIYGFVKMPEGTDRLKVLQDWAYKFTDGFNSMIVPHLAYMHYWTPLYNATTETRMARMIQRYRWFNLDPKLFFETMYTYCKGRYYKNDSLTNHPELAKALTALKGQLYEARDISEDFVNGN